MRKIRKLLKSLGPGFITGASDDDPSGIATYSQTGAQFGYSQLWLSLFCFPFMTIVQEMCGRIGIVTGKGIAGVTRTHYTKSVLYIAVFILFVANTINIGANLGAMAGSLGLLIPLPFAVLLISMTILTLSLEIFVSYKLYVRFLKYLTFALFAYIITVFIIKQDWQAVLVSTVIPHVSFSKEYLLNIVAILGTTISPYLFFWQAGEEVEEAVSQGKLQSMGRGTPEFSSHEIKAMRIDTAIGMLFSQVVMFFIIVTTASTLHNAGIHTIETADQAALALRPLAGDFAFFLFAIGIIGTGLLSVPVLAGSAAYAISETFSWKEGLYRNIRQAKGFYGVIIVATLFGVIANFSGIPPFKLLYYTAVLNGLTAPPLLVLILLITNNQQIMGKRTNSLFTNILGIGITVIMAIASTILIGSYFFS